MSRDDLSGGDFERRKQCCGAMPLVVVTLAGQGAAIWQLQIALRSLQSLDRGLFVHAQHNGLRGRGDIEANNIGGFGRKVRVGALAPGLASREINLVAAQEPPDILDVNIAQRLGQQRAGPARKPLRGRLIQQLQNPLVGRLRINRLLARPRLVFQPFKAMVGIAVPPKADNPRLDPNFLGDRAGAAPVRRQQNDPRPLQIALQRHRRATTRFKHLAIFPRKVDFSCFGYHPYLESRLTIQEKWVLVGVFASAINHTTRPEDRVLAIRWLGQSRDVVASDVSSIQKLKQLNALINSRTTIAAIAKSVSETASNYRKSNLPLSMKIALPATLAAIPFVGGHAAGIAAFGGALGVPVLLLVFLGTAGITAIIEAVVKTPDARTHIAEI